MGPGTVGEYLNRAREKDLRWPLPTKLDDAGLETLLFFHLRTQKRLVPSIRQVHRAGEKGFVDFAGQQPTVVDPETGEV